MYKVLLMIAGAVAVALASDKSADVAEAASHANSIGMAETGRNPWKTGRHPWYARMKKIDYARVMKTWHNYKKAYRFCRINLGNKSWKHSYFCLRRLKAFVHYRYAWFLYYRH
jgi:uncharacterized membrane protein